MAKKEEEFSLNPVEDSLNKRKKKNKIMLFSGGGVFAVIGLVFGAHFLIGGNTEEIIDELPETGYVSTSGPNRNQPEEIQADGITLAPIKLEEWEFHPWNIIDQNALMELTADYFANMDLHYTTFAQFPARSEGFHNDPDRQWDAPYIPNAWYAEVLSEDVELFLVNALTRLFNPVYGMWSDMAYIGNYDGIIDRFADLFSEDLLRHLHSNQDDFILPFVPANNFERHPNSYWFGRVNDAQMELHRDEFGVPDEFTANFTMTLSTLDIDRNLVEENINLTMTVLTPVHGRTNYSISSLSISR